MALANFGVRRGSSLIALYAFSSNSIKLICDGKSLSKPSVADQLTVLRAVAIPAAAVAGGSGIKVVVVAAAKPCRVARRSRGCRNAATACSTAAAARCLMFAVALLPVVGAVLPSSCPRGAIGSTNRSVAARTVQMV